MPSDGAPSLRRTIGDELQRLCELMVFLRSPQGCNWDHTQTLSSLRPYLLEETYEVIDAIDDLEKSLTAQNTQAHCEELGDLLFQIVFQTEIQRENQAFDFGDVCQNLREKLIRRHPHLFRDDKDKGKSGENPHWERIKHEERVAKNQSHKSILDGVPRAMPALLKTQRISEKAAQVGFDWPNVNVAMDKVDEEIAELKEAMASGNKAHIEHELGDAIFTLVNIARHLKLDAESCLQTANKRFTSRFQHIEDGLRSEGKSLMDAGLDELEQRWQKAKSLV